MSDALNDPSAAQYHPTSQVSVPPSQAVDHAGTLPFTGADVGVLVVVAVAMFAMAAFLRRLAKP